MNPRLAALTQRPTRNRSATILSIVLHGLGAVVVVLLARQVATEERVKAVVKVVFHPPPAPPPPTPPPPRPDEPMALPPPPPPPPPRARLAPQRKPIEPPKPIEEPHPEPRQPVQPLAMPEPDRLAGPDATAVEGDAGPAGPGGQEGGVAGGREGGIAGGDPSAPRAIGPEVTPPRRLKAVQARYPDGARAARLSGEVVIECIIDTEGNVHVNRVLNSIPRLDSAAIEAVEKWKYEPARWHGRAQAVFLVVRMQFNLM